MEYALCFSSKNTALKQGTILTCESFPCRKFRRRFNGHPETRFNYLELTTRVALLIVRCRFRYQLSLRHLEETFLVPSLALNPEVVRERVTRSAPLLRNTGM